MPPSLSCLSFQRILCSVDASGQMARRIRRNLTQELRLDPLSLAMHIHAHHIVVQNLAKYHKWPHFPKLFLAN